MAQKTLTSGCCGLPYAIGPGSHCAKRKTALMTSMRLFLITIALICAPALACCSEPTLIQLISGHKPYVVPGGHVWKVERLDPYESETGVGTADLSIQGSVQVGQDRGLNIYGTFDFTLSSKQHTPLWILAGSKISVGDSRRSLVVKDFKDR